MYVYDAWKFIVVSANLVHNSVDANVTSEPLGIYYVRNATYLLLSSLLSTLLTSFAAYTLTRPLQIYVQYSSNAAIRKCKYVFPLLVVYKEYLQEFSITAELHRLR